MDTGATHLLRLGALPAGSPWGDWLLHDHEDNLFWKGWGLANEPVYNPQATAYLLRDEPEAVVRAFYSYLACAFSHSALEPVEHRWTWGQYFGPPSTDGAWFDLYRHMLIREIEDGGLVLCQATPRRWLEDGKRIEVERAPTYFGEISFCVVSSAAAGSISTEVRTPDRLRPERLLVRLRHPRRAQIRAAAVNGEDWNHLDARKEWIIIEKPDAPRYSIVVHY
ncbi:MAG: hypothetical protein JXA90_17290 [Planctomycetes bacterium]|nr:hypothetical protein [Planctomycetota bacterium]